MSNAEIVKRRGLVKHLKTSYGELSERQTDRQHKIWKSEIESAKYHNCLCDMLLDGVAQEDLLQCPRSPPDRL